MKIKFNFLIINTLFIFCFFSTSEAQKFIDIDNFYFIDHGKTGIRIAIFDIDKQTYSSINYYHIGKTDREEEKEIEIPHENIKIFSTGNVEILGNIDELFIIRSFANISCNIEEHFINKKQILPSKWQKINWEFFDVRDKTEYKKQIVHNKISLLSAETIINEKYPYKSHARYGKHFEAGYYKRKNKGSSFEKSESLTFGQILTYKHSRGGELGYLGELSVEMTMISCGYFKRLTSQNNSNQGIDGIYINDNEPPEMFLTESKGQSSSQKQNTAKTIFNKCLTDKHIEEVLETMLKGGGRFDNEIFQKTAQLVNQFIKSTPEKLFKWAHRLKVDGKCEYYGERCNLTASHEAGSNNLSPESPLKDKTIAISNLLARLSLSPEEKVELYLEASPLSPDNLLKALLNSQGISETQQKDAFKILNLRFDSEKPLLPRNLNKEFDREEEKENES